MSGRICAPNRTAYPRVNASIAVPYDGRLAWDLINATQSNPEQAHETLTQWVYLDQKISELDT